MLQNVQFLLHSAHMFARVTHRRVDGAVGRTVEVTISVSDCLGYVPNGGTFSAGCWAIEQTMTLGVSAIVSTLCSEVTFLLVTQVDPLGRVASAATTAELSLVCTLIAPGPFHSGSTATGTLPGNKFD